MSMAKPTGRSTTSSAIEFSLPTPDAAVQALESIATSLADASPEEKKALLHLCIARAVELKNTDDPELVRKRDFYLGFGEAFSIYPE
jgi:hypothetical protein